MLKCRQLYETVNVRHGLMVVGRTYSGKTKVIHSLQKALNIIHQDHIQKAALVSTPTSEDLLRNRRSNKWSIFEQEYYIRVSAMYADGSTIVQAETYNPWGAYSRGCKPSTAT